MHPHTATVCHLRALVPVVAAGGLSEAQFLERLDVDPTCLGDVDARVPKEVVATAWGIAAAVTRNESVGLLASLHAPPGTFPVLDHIAANLATVGDALRSIARYCRLCDPELAMSFEIGPQGGLLTLVFGNDERRYSRHWSEWFIGLMVSRARTLSGRPEICPVQVKFQHEPPANQETLRSILGCGVVFSSSTTAITFDHATLALPVRDASAFLSRVLTAHAERDLRLTDTGDAFSARVRLALIDMLERDGPRLQDLARWARCSARTLQTRLRKEGTSYEKLLDEVRRQLALQYIADDSIRLIEIPLLLKFADPSPFHRAFRRWTGRTPLEYRQARRNSASSPALEAAAR